VRSNSSIESEPGEPYFTDLRERWSAALRAAHASIPPVPYGAPPYLPPLAGEGRVGEREGVRTA